MELKIWHGRDLLHEETTASVTFEAIHGQRTVLEKHAPYFIQLAKGLLTTPTFRLHVEKGGVAFVMPSSVVVRLS